MPTPVRIIERRPKEAPCCGGANIITSEVLGKPPCEDVQVSRITNGDFDIMVDVGSPAPTFVNSWNIFRSFTSGGDVSWSPNQITVTSNSAPSGYYLYYYALNGMGALVTEIDPTKTLYFSFDLTAINIRAGKILILTIQSPVSYYQVDLTPQAFGHYSIVLNPGDWLPGGPPGGFGQVGFGIPGAEMITFLIITGTAGLARDDDYSIDNVLTYQLACI